MTDWGRLSRPMPSTFGVSLWHINLSVTFEGFLNESGNYKTMVIIWWLYWCPSGHWFTWKIGMIPTCCFLQKILCPNSTSNFIIQTYDHVVFWLELSYPFFCVCGGHIKIHLNILYIYAIQYHSISINSLIFNNKKAPCVPWKSSPRVNLFGHWMPTRDTGSVREVIWIGTLAFTTCRWKDHGSAGPS